MIEVFAQRNNGFDNSFEEIIIKINDQKIILDKENSQKLVDVLTGKQGVIFEQNKDEYQPRKVILFSCSEPLTFYSCEKESS
jgi:tRNA G18 (ribose-2'-O)-methylase SpoU